MSTKTSGAMSAGDDAVALVKELCDDLDAEPLFHASLGSKELFHSNLIAWFVDRQREAARQVFDSWTRPHVGAPDGTTERERLHLDLVIHLRDCAPLVVENKVFSPPKDEQLAQYAQEVAHRFDPLTPEFVLLSLSDPGWPAGQRELGGHIWHRRSYGDLAVAMTEASEVVGDQYERETIERYARVINALQRLATIVAVDVTDATRFALPAEFRSALEGVRLTQGFEKLRTRSVAHYIEHRLAAQGLESVTVVDGYTRSWPILEGFVQVGDTGEEIGWQYQEGQWRLAVRVRPGHRCHGRGDAMRARREKHVAARYTEWFDFADIDAILASTGTVPTAGTPGYKSFAPDFVYLYRAARDLTVGQLCDLVGATMRRAQALKPSG